MIVTLFVEWNVYFLEKLFFDVQSFLQTGGRAILRNFDKTYPLLSPAPYFSVVLERLTVQLLSLRQRLMNFSFSIFIGTPCLTAVSGGRFGILTSKFLLISGSLIVSFQVCRFGWYVGYLHCLWRFGLFK